MPGLLLFVNPQKGPAVTQVADEIYRRSPPAEPSLLDASDASALS